MKEASSLVLYTLRKQVHIRPLSSDKGFQKLKEGPTNIDKVRAFNKFRGVSSERNQAKMVIRITILFIETTGKVGSKGETKSMIQQTILNRTKICSSLSGSFPCFLFHSPTLYCIFFFEERG